MPGPRFSVLGPLEVHVDGRLVEVPPGRRRAVLTCLLVHAGRLVPPDVLIDAAWSSDLPHDPHAALHTVLSRLRGHLGAGVVDAAPGGYRLSVPWGAVDADEFEKLVDSARSAEPTEAEALLRRALALWRGPAHGEYADAPFASVESIRLNALRLDAIEAHAAACIDCGDPGEAVALLDRLLAEEPFREHAVELSMTALYHAGRQADALERFRGYRRTLVEELGLEPSPALLGLQDRILGHELHPVRPVASTLPVWLDSSTAFIGREDDLADLVTAVTQNRVTVVTGPGGVGKSRLAAEALAPISDRLVLPVTVTELAGVSPGRVAAAVADTLGLRLTADPVTDALVEYLGAVPHLLVLDNCEHLLDEVSPLVSHLARRCRDVRVLATSRRRLVIPSERVVPLAPLRVPDSAGTLGAQQATAAVRLFADRVRRLRPAFAVTADNAAAVAELCRRLDGLPLALELAASRAATFGAAEVVEGISDDLVREGPDSLHAVVAWSYRLLAEHQRALLDVLSVFSGHFTVDAVRRVAAHLPAWHGDATAALAELVESSLVVCHVDGSTVHYRLLAIVRAFAADRLAASDQAAAASLAHANWVRDLTAQIAVDWARADGAGVGARLAGSSVDIGRAVQWALAVGRIQLAASIGDAVMRCLHWTPGLELADLLIETAEQAARDASPALAGGVAAGAFFTAERGELDRTRRLATAAVQMANGREAATIAYLALGVAAMYAGDRRECARWFERMASSPTIGGEAHSSLALLACYADDLTAAREHAAIALAAGASMGAASQAFARYAAGEVEARTDSVRGAELLADAADEADRICAGQVSRVARVALFALLVRSGRHGEAVALGCRLLGELRRWGAWPQTWTTLRMLAELLAETGRPADAAFFLGAAHAADSAPPPVGQDVARYAALEHELSDELGRRVLNQIRDLAAGTPRARVLTRAEHVLATVPHRRSGQP